MATATFEVRKFRDIEVVVNVADEKRPINLTKLAASLTGSRTSFRDVVKKNIGFWKIIASYTASETAEDRLVSKDTSLENNDSEMAKDLVEAFASTKNHDLQGLFDKGVLIFFNGQPSWRAGVYGPTWLADWIAINFKPEFFKQIHELFELVDSYAQNNNVSFAMEIEKLKNDYEDKISRGEKRIGTLEEMLCENRENMRIQRKEHMELMREIVALKTEAHDNKEVINELTLEVRDGNEALQTMLTKQDETHRVITQVSEQLREYDGRNLTTKTYNEILKIYIIREQQPRNGNVKIYSFCGNPDNFERSLKQRNLELEDIQLLGSFNTANAKDLIYSVAREMGLKISFRTVETPYGKMGPRNVADP